MFFASRRRRGPDLHLDWKVRLFFFGALLAVIGIGTDSDFIVLAAIAVLVLGALLRFLPGGRGSEPEEEESAEDEEWAEDEDSVGGDDSA